MGKTDHLYIKSTKDVEWGAPKTIRQMIAQLETMDPDLAVHGIMFTEIGDKRVAIAKHLSMSFERVDGRRIKERDETVPYSLALWTSDDERSGPPLAYEAAKPAAPVFRGVGDTLEEAVIAAVYSQHPVPKMMAGEIEAGPFDTATSLATAIMALDWKARKDWSVEEQADRHGELQEMIEAALASTAPAAEKAEAVGEIVMFDGVGKEVSWRKGKLPPVGSKLYATPPDALAKERS